MSNAKKKAIQVTESSSDIDPNVSRPKRFDHFRDNNLRTEDSASENEENLSINNQVEHFEFKKYSHIFWSGYAGGALFICYPVILGTTGQFGQLVSSNNSITLVLIPVLIIAFGGAIGGFLSLISKQNRLWPAFVMGLSFNSVMTSVLPNSSPQSQNKMEERISPPSETLEFSGSFIFPDFNFINLAYAEDCPQNSETKLNLIHKFFEWTDCDDERQSLSLIENTALAKHKEILIKAFKANPEKAVPLRIIGKRDPGINIQVHYGDQITNFSLNSNILIIPFLEKITKITIYGGKNLQSSSFEVRSHLKTLTIELGVDIQKASLSAINKASAEGIFKVVNWQANYFD